MPSWLVALSVGPVGDFIGGGRRSRDLWWGSGWVSQCTVAIVDAFLQTAEATDLEVELVVPSQCRFQQIREARAAGSPMRYDRRISNRILIEVMAPEVAKVAEVVKRATVAGREELGLQLDRAKEGLPKDHPKDLARVAEAVRALLKVDSYERQHRAIVDADDFLEIYAAWTPNTGSFQEVVTRVSTLLDARKNARFFSAPTWSVDGERKSDLDPGRDTVLESTAENDREVTPQEAASRKLDRQILGIGPDENLDALGFARRIAAFYEGPTLGKLPFPPITRVAADPWFTRVSEDSSASPALGAIRAILEQRKVKNHPLFFTWCSPARDPGGSSTGPGQEGPSELFPYDASFLFENGIAALWRRLDRLRANAGTEAKLIDQALGHLSELRPHVEKLHRHCGLPSPYYALLAMDGDGIGRALSEAKDRSILQGWVRSLDEFADRAAEVVADHNGCAFYVGGDDLMAYLPVDRVIEAARKLCDHFAPVAEVFSDRAHVSLSGGIVLAHAKSDLRSVRARAQKALYLAKAARAECSAFGNESWLHVCERPRSGTERSTTGPLREIVNRLSTWQRLLAKGQLSLQSSRHLAEMAHRFADSSESGGNTGLELAIHRIQAQGRRSSKTDNKELTTRLSAIKNWGKVQGVSGQLLIAARLHRASVLRPRSLATSQGGPS